MGARILVIEDTPHNLALFTYLLAAYGHEVIASETAEEGLTLASVHRPDLIITDLYLPGIDGYEFLAALRGQAALAATPVIAVTAFATAGDHNRVLAAGFDGYLTKPIDPTAFHASIADLLPPDLRGAPPASVSDDGSGDPVAAPPVASPERRARLLLVDDNDTNLVLLRTVLEPHGYRITTAGSMDEALHELGRARPDVILSDVHMQGGSGVDLLAKVRADPALATVPFAFLTASESQVDALRRKHHVTVIREPIDPADLLLRVDALLVGQPGR